MEKDLDHALTLHEAGYARIEQIGATRVWTYNNQCVPLSSSFLLVPLDDDKFINAYNGQIYTKPQTADVIKLDHYKQDNL